MLFFIIDDEKFGGYFVASLSNTFDDLSDGIPLGMVSLGVFGMGRVVVIFGDGEVVGFPDVIGLAVPYRSIALNHRPTV
jgi:hypothetical protein